MRTLKTQILRKIYLSSIITTLTIGFNPMHKRIRVLENIAHIAEHKYARNHFANMYCDEKTKAESVKNAHEHFKSEFKKQLGIKYFVPDPINGGNSNTGPQIKRILSNISVSAEIFEIAPTTLYLVGKCCDFVNRVTFVNPCVYEKFAAAAFAGVMCDLGNYANITANTHSLLCHAPLYIRWAQNELGVSLGALSENSLEKGNKQNKLYRQLFSYRSDIKRENKDIFMWRLLVSDPFLLLEGEWKQELRKGHVLEYRKKLKLARLSK